MKRFLVLLCVAALLVGIVAVPAAAGHRHHKVWRPVYLALGDSIAAGQAADDWSTDGYVPLFKKYLKRHMDCWPWRADLDHCKPLLLKNLGRPSIPELGLPGVTSELVIEEQLPVALRIIEKRNYDKRWLNDVRMITLNVGGNDISGPVADACIEADPFDPAVCIGTITAVFGEYQANLTEILGSLRAIAPDTPIIMSTVYNPIVGCPLADQYPIAPLFADLVLEGGTAELPDIGPVTIEHGFNDIIEAVAGAFGVAVADVYSVMEPDDYVGDCLHPNTTGHRTIYKEYRETYEDTFGG
jgi:lysophospholipase L1-like esterase